MNAITPIKVEGKVFSHNGMEAEVILASVSENSPPIYTIRTRYPRIIHGELMTHRVFNRNARSSRAVPVMTMLAELRSGTAGMTFVPTYWGKNQKGMQADQECDAPIIVPEICGHTAGQETDRESMWLWLRDAACDVAEAYADAGYHKQVVNRLTETYSYIDTLITATDWANFFWLRDDKDAEPHFRDLARLVKAAIDDATLEYLEPHQWHLPYITQEDVDWVEAKNEDDTNAALRKISAARCARISYKPFDGDASYEKEIDRYKMLTGGGKIHASPLEHQACPDTMSMFELRRVSLEGGPDEIVSRQMDWDNKQFHGSLRGYVQNRKIIPGEAVFD